jgi:two-component system response regulator
MTTPMPHVLVVDDNPGDIELIRTAFEMAGVEVVVDTCQDGIEAMRFLEQAAPIGPLPKLVLLDLNMPRANGFEVLAFLRERHLVEQIPVVVLSTSAQNEDRRRCLDLGARKMYTKPETFSALRSLIGELQCYLTPPGANAPVG